MMTVTFFSLRIFCEAKFSCFAPFKNTNKAYENSRKACNALWPAVTSQRRVLTRLCKREGDLKIPSRVSQPMKITGNYGLNYCETCGFMHVIPPFRCVSCNRACALYRRATFMSFRRWEELFLFRYRQREEIFWRQLWCSTLGCLFHDSRGTDGHRASELFLGDNRARQDDTIMSPYNGPIMVRYGTSHCFRDKALCPMDVYGCRVSRFTELTSRTVSKLEC